MVDRSDREGAGGDNGGAAQSQSHYFLPFDTSHLTKPPPDRRPPAYTLQQKDEAIRLLNEGTRAQTIADQIGGSCSKANPYRWRAEAEADRRERQIQRQRARQEWIQQRVDAFMNFVHFGHAVFVFFLWAELIAFLLTFVNIVSIATIVWIFWRLTLDLLLDFPEHFRHELILWLYLTSVIIFWICIVCNVGTAPLFVRSRYYPYNMELNREALAW